MVYVGIDLGGTSIKAGLVDEQGKILCKATCPTCGARRASRGGRHGEAVSGSD